MPGRLPNLKSESEYSYASEPTSEDNKKACCERNEPSSPPDPNKLRLPPTPGNPGRASTGDELYDQNNRGHNQDGVNEAARLKLPANRRPYVVWGHPIAVHDSDGKLLMQSRATTLESGQCFKGMPKS